MLRSLIVLPAVATTILTITAQDCTTGRYHTFDLFSDVTVTSAIEFGSNIGVTGAQQTLRLDVYRPTGDTETERPVIVVAFGGSFITGDRTQVAPICQAFARMGYVAVAPDYRVGFFLPNASTTTMAVMRGAHDMKACVRFLKKSVAEEGNPYGIDPDRIIIGGVSAGAISALHATYLDQESEIPEVVAVQVAAQGGVEGNSGNPGFSSKPFACFSFSGAIGDTTWIEPGDVPLASIHEVNDGVVPYYTQEVFVVGLPTGLVASGSHDIHVRCDNIALDNCFKSYDTNGHTAYLQNDAVNALGFIANYAAKLVCDHDFDCAPIALAVSDHAAPGIGIHPNPTTGATWIDMPANGLVEVFNMNGQRVWSERLRQGGQWLDLSGLATGVYMLRMEGTPATRLVIAEQE